MVVTYLKEELTHSEYRWGLSHSLQQQRRDLGLGNFCVFSFNEVVLNNPYGSGDFIGFKEATQRLLDHLCGHKHYLTW